jgi:hypothetical protein
MACGTARSQLLRCFRRLTPTLDIDRGPADFSALRRSVHATCLAQDAPHNQYRYYFDRIKGENRR